MQLAEAYSSVGLASDFFSSLETTLSRMDVASGDVLPVLITCRDPAALEAVRPLRRVWPDLVDLSTVGGFATIGRPVLEDALRRSRERVPLFLLLSHGGASPDGGRADACTAIRRLQCDLDDASGDATAEAAKIDDHDFEYGVLRYVVRDALRRHHAFSEDRDGETRTGAALAGLVRTLSVERIEQLLACSIATPRRYSLVSGTIATARGSAFVCDGTGYLRVGRSTRPLGLTSHVVH